MAHGVNPLKGKGESKAGVGSRRIFAPHFKLQVLDSYRSDADCKGNQRATARKYGIHRRQIQKWLQAEGALRSSVSKGGRLPGGGPPAPRERPARAPSPDPAPMDLSLKRPAPASPAGLAEPRPDVWDLSAKRKPEDASPKPPPKLFKPYLDDSPKKPDVPPCCTYCYNNNNNDVNAYTITELQPHTPPTLYYTPFPAYSPPEYEVPPFYEDPNYAPLKQRHSYSLDFKLSAIECYYQDSVCKGNQRAVASKYNIHRRQVQKWLKQADELRQKNETIKCTQMVR